MNTPLHPCWTLVTGASRGIGAATALALAQQGHAILVHHHQSVHAAQTLVQRIQDLGAAAACVQADLASPQGPDQLFAQVDEVLQTHAGSRLQGLVNNAGVVDMACRVDGMSLSRLQRMFTINLQSPMLCAGHAVRRMSTRHGGAGGSIVNVSSVAAVLGSPGQYVDYAASKGGIDTFTIGLAREVAGEGIRVNAVRPGIIDTEIHASGGQPDRAQRAGPALPMGRAGTADEVAQAIAWLMSPAASYTTGALLDVAGGR